MRRALVAMTVSSRSVIGLGLLFLLAPGTVALPQGGRAERIADARPGDVRILATAAIRIPLEAVRAEASKAIGHPLAIEYGSARGNLKDAIMAGTGFEVALLLPDVDEQLLKAGKITSQGIVIGRTEVAIGLRGDGTPDLRTPTSLKTAMMNARSLRWADTGAALLTVNKILDTLQIRDAVKARHNMAAAPIPLGRGEYEINIYPLSEILANTNLRNAGPVIPELQVPAIVTATISAHTPNAAAARALVTFLQGPAIEPALKSNGFSR
jgi:molybdate transport system substrate-binding protein